MKYGVFTVQADIAADLMFPEIWGVYVGVFTVQADIAADVP